MEKIIIGSVLFIGGVLLCCAEVIGNANGFLFFPGIIFGLIGLCILAACTGIKCQYADVVA